ncbi:MAG: hypothetical protein Q4B42_01945, partial [Oscillospiraceae bacterium]|nr:hypothetical protein [Oscillospiraceae bacterium]
EYFGTTVRITVREREVVPNTTYKEFAIFGNDLSVPYNSIRSALRNLIGVEKTTEPRTELRVTQLLEQTITVSGLSGVTESVAEAVEASTTSSYEIEDLELAAGEEVIFESEDEDIAYVRVTGEGEDVAYYINGESTGSTVITARIGFYKQVDDETYAAYLAATGQDAQPEETEGEEEETSTEEEEETETPVNQIFVTTRAITYPVNV